MSYKWYNVLSCQYKWTNRPQTGSPHENSQSDLRLMIRTLREKLAGRPEMTGNDESYTENRTQCTILPSSTFLHGM